jgi:hypothetical protein
MKASLKILLIVIVIAAAAYGGYLLRGKPASVPVVQDATPATVQESSAPIKMVKETEALSINITYPEIPGTGNAVARANTSIKSGIDERVASFEKDATDSMTVDIGLPKEVKSTVAGSPSIEEKNDRYISIFMGMEWYMRGAAHPAHTIDTYVYDLKEGKLVNSSDLFKADADYLAFLSSYSRSDLVAQSKKSNDGYIFDQQMLADGTAPTKENFSKVLPTKDGLIIYFDEYQVAPYAAGPQQVVIPYAKLKNLIDPDGALGMYI